MFLQHLALLQALPQPLQSTLSTFPLSPPITLPSCATAGILSNFILLPSKAFRSCPYPCIIKSAHHSAFDQVLNCHPLLPRLFYPVFLQSLLLLYTFAQQKQIAVNYVYIPSVSLSNIFHHVSLWAFCHFQFFPTAGTLKLTLTLSIFSTSVPSHVPLLSHPTLYSHYSIIEALTKITPVHILFHLFQIPFLYIMCHFRHSILFDYCPHQGLNSSVSTFFPYTKSLFMMWHFRCFVLQFSFPHQGHKIDIRLVYIFFINQFLFVCQSRYFALLHSFPQHGQAYLYLHCLSPPHLAMSPYIMCRLDISSY